MLLLFFLEMPGLGELCDNCFKNHTYVKVDRRINVKNKFKYKENHKEKYLMILNKKFEGLNILTLSDRMNKLYPNSGQTRIKTSPG